MVHEHAKKKSSMKTISMASHANKKMKQRLCIKSYVISECAALGHGDRSQNNFWQPHFQRTSNYNLLDRMENKKWSCL